jgi:hypothetical protein
VVVVDLARGPTARGKPAGLARGVYVLLVVLWTMAAEGAAVVPGRRLLLRGDVAAAAVGLEVVLCPGEVKGRRLAGRTTMAGATDLLATSSVYSSSSYSSPA